MSTHSKDDDDDNIVTIERMREKKMLANTNTAQSDAYGQHIVLLF